MDDFCIVVGRALVVRDQDTFFLDPSWVELKTAKDAFIEGQKHFANVVINHTEAKPIGGDVDETAAAEGQDRRDQLVDGNDVACGGGK
ncbi:hypothetical protein OGAPHI_007413 [Ogataea philodendri]|uniref:Uncharacterized protein n=1 Tax=Ogataea philodendri TaxID=1378263 RepID=A0A9P8NUP1_9ASCO|nr:uncharacterized protein OGAPHI_007413 [Ogataea philodendri]KAH3660208.1 hypothetical protein OGAPHI_007413 [Ogataea philodendri]